MIRWSKHSRRRVPTSRSATAFARGAHGREHRLDAEPSRTLDELATVDGVPVADQVRGRATPRRRVDQLTPDPGGGRLRRDGEVLELAPGVRDEEQDVERPKGQG